MSLAYARPRVHRAELVWPFGRHKGKPVTALPIDFVCWFLDQHDSSPNLKQLLRHVFDIDLPDDDIGPDPAAASVVLPGLIWRWNEAMTELYATDPEALAVVQAGLFELQRLCTEYTRKSWWLPTEPSNPEAPA